MRTLVISLVLGALALGPSIVDAEKGDSEQPSRPSEAAVNASSVILPCVPVAAYWSGPPRSEGMPPGPELAIVSTDVRPKNARVHLDDRFVGRARYLDGRPGYLYLAPGLYRLELRLDGYRTVTVDLEAGAGCRYDLKHRLERIKGQAKENTKVGYGKGRPFNRVFAPIANEMEPEAGPAHADPSLRPDLAVRKQRAFSREGAALRLKVIPESASISIDGEFRATARELERMEAPLATSAGGHRITVTAPGFRTVERTVELAPGQILEVEIELTRETTIGDSG